MISEHKINFGDFLIDSNWVLLTIAFVCTWKEQYSRFLFFLSLSNIFNIMYKCLPFREKNEKLSKHYLTWN